jgi:hypothetical protein
METCRVRSDRKAALAALDSALKAMFVEAARRTPAHLLDVLERLEQPLGKVAVA